MVSNALWMVSFKCVVKGYQECRFDVKDGKVFQGFKENIFMYKVKYRLVPDFICDIFSTKSCKYNFRNQNFDIPRFNSVLYGKHSLRYLGPFLWNKLDKNITETSSLSRFKFHIRCRDLTELINGNNCSACVICTSLSCARVPRIVLIILAYCKCLYNIFNNYSTSARWI